MSKILDMMGVENLKNVRALTFTALLAALTIVGDLLPRIILVPGIIEIRFGFIFLAVIAFLFGPVFGFVAGIITNLIAFLLLPGGDFNPIYDLLKGLEGIFYAAFLYKKNFKSEYFIIWIVVARLHVNVICNMIIRTYILIQTGRLPNEIITIISLRVVPNVARLPIDIILLFTILMVVAKIAQQYKFINLKSNK